MTTLAVEGMTCAACSSSVTDALRAVPGVKDAVVSLLTNEAKVDHDIPFDSNLLVLAVEDCGFDASVVSSAGLLSKSAITNIEISGMTCAACSLAVTEALESVEGVSSASVSLLTNSARVDHSKTVNPALLVDAVEACGFDGRISSTLPNSEGAAGGGEFEPPQELRLQIFGIDDSTDVSQLQYNIEALLSGVEGVSNVHFSLAGSSGPVTSTSDIGDDIDVSESINELTLTYDPSHVGIRAVVDTLGGVDDRIRFFIVNSLDQSLAAQLRLLSRTKETQQWRWIFLQSLIFGIPVVAVNAISGTAFSKRLVVFRGLFVALVVELALASHILFNLGGVFFRKTAVFVRSGMRQANMDVLVCLLTQIAYWFSVLAIASGVWHGSDSPPKVLFETTAMLVAFVSFGKWMESKAKGATSSALSRLVSLTPTTCQILESEAAEAAAKAAEVGELPSMSPSDLSNQPSELLSDLPSKLSNPPSESPSAADAADDNLPSKPSAAGAASASSGFRSISVDLLQKNDIAVILPGGKIPADGTIVYGETEVDESLLTGESMPVHKRPGDSVVGGSINGPFLVHMRVTRAGRNSHLHQIIDIVRDSQTSRAPVQRFADAFASRFVGGVLTLAAITFLFWIIYCTLRSNDHLPMAFSSEPAGRYFVCLKLAISVIVVACPCALGLAAPTAVMVGTGVSATHGALIKGGDVLEKTSAVNVILFDKTGTLTAGEMHVARAHVTVPISEKHWWGLVGSVEMNSEHPVGRALVREARHRCGLRFDDDVFDTCVGNFETATGLGVKAKVSRGLISDISGIPGISGISGVSVAVGSKRFVVRDYPEAREGLAAALDGDLRSLTCSVAHVIINGVYAGYVELVDQIKPSARGVLGYLHDRGVHVGIVTGDSREVALSVARQVGVPAGNVFSEVSPLDKDKVVSELRERLGGEGNVCIGFVGDGINDAPALVQADVGMAIASGTDIAMDSAEIVLVGLKDDDLGGVVTALEVSAATLHKIKANFFFATVYNAIMLPLAMGCFLPFNVMLPPAAAAASMALSSVSVVVNSLVLRNWTPPTVVPADSEETVGEGSGFSLKTSTLEEFNAAKPSAWRFFRRGKFFRRASGYKLLSLGQEESTS